MTENKRLSKNEITQLRQNRELAGHVPPITTFVGELRPSKEEINRRKQARLRARLDLVARRMGFASWGDFGKKFSQKLLELEVGKATEHQVNGAIKFLMLRAMKAIKDGDKKMDTELQEVTDSAPRIRENW